jgi:alanine-synthesizing transaminase
VPGQWAIQTALGGYQSIKDLVARAGACAQRDLAYELITQIPGVSCVKPQAALYMFPRLDPAMYPIDDDQFFMEVLRATRVMLVQGTGFNYPDNQHFRIVFLPHKSTCARPSGGWRSFWSSTASAPSPPACMPLLQKKLLALDWRWPEWVLFGF